MIRRWSVSNRYINILKKSMAKEDKSREFRFENIEKTRSYFIKEKNKNELIS